MMDFSFPVLSVPPYYDALQLNRIELMLMQLMTKLSGKDNFLKFFASSRVRLLSEIALNNSQAT